MSSHVSAAPPSINGAGPLVNRPSACKYQPTLWGDHFLKYASHSEEVNGLIDRNRYEGLKENIKRTISDDMKGEACKKLRFIDAVQRLGVAYHFKSEIEDALVKIYHNHNNEGDDLFTASLHFRLLRQQGYKVSCDVFEKFKDGEGHFKATLIDDVQGMLSFYEAAHLGIRGEDILDEAIDFTTRNLMSVLPQLGPYQAKEVSRAVDRPIRKWLGRVEARHYMDVYARDEFHNSTLLELAKLDFNILQRMHQRELSDITRWWKNLDVTTKLPYARDRIVELYFWVVGVYFEPQYSLARKMLTKVIACASILDDTFDSYGIYEELEPLNEAIQRWDDQAIVNQLPETIRLVYEIVTDVYNEIEDELAKEGRSYCFRYAKDAMKRLVQCYFTEAKWLNEGHIPTTEEYFPISIVSGGYMMLITNSIVGMGPIASTGILEWASQDPKIVTAASVVARFANDIVSHKFEQERSHVASGIEIYVKHHGLSEKEVVKMFRKEVANAWKDINEEFLRPTAAPVPILERALNFARAIDVMYKDEDGYTNPHVIKDFVASVLKDPVAV